MDKAPSAVPAGLHPRAQEQTVAPGQPHCGRRNRRARALPLPLAFALWIGGPFGLGATEAYLPSVGPLMLRFAPKPAAQLAWAAVAQPQPALVAKPSPPPMPVPPSAPAPSASLALPTLEELLGPPPPLPQPAATEAPLQAAPAPIVTPPLELSAESPATPPAALVGSPLSASELLVVTPQMLAEYLKSPPGRTNSPAPSVISGEELYFRPPVAAPATGSKATYRVQ